MMSGRPFLLASQASQWTAVIATATATATAAATATVTDTDTASAASTAKRVAAR